MANDLTQIYQTYLGRAPDAAGVEWWNKGGVTDQDVQDIINSPEAQAYAKSQNVTFSGPQNAVTATPTNTVTNPYYSPQSMDINAAYQAYLGRAPDESGLNYWGSTIDPHEWADFLGSKGIQREWQDIRNAYNTQQGITGLAPNDIADWSLSNPMSAADAYRHYLGREGEQTGLDFWGNTKTGTANIDPNEFLNFMAGAGKEMGGLRALLNQPKTPTNPTVDPIPTTPTTPTEDTFSPTPWSPEPPVKSTIEHFNTDLKDPMSGKNWRGTVMDALTQSLGGGSQEGLYAKVKDMLSQGKSVSEITRDLNLGMGHFSAVIAELNKLAKEKGWDPLPLPGAVPEEFQNYYHYGFGPGEVQFTRTTPQGNKVVNPLAHYFAEASKPVAAAKGGHIKGGLGAIKEDPIIQRYVKGGKPTGGQEDDIPAVLSNNEYVMDADTVSALGDGNPDAGALKLDKMRENIRKHKRSASPKKIPPKAKAPEQYMKGK